MSKASKASKAEYTYKGKIDKASKLIRQNIKGVN